METAADVGRAVVFLVGPLLGLLALIRSSFRWASQVLNP